MSEFPHYPTPFTQLINSISRLPGVGKRSAERLALALYDWPEADLEIFSNQISGLKNQVNNCQKCGNFADKALCNICLNPQRDSKFVCVVETVAQIPIIEKSGSFHGHYHVLGGKLSPVNGIGPDKLNLQTLLDNVADIEEIIIATNSDFSGEATASYIANLLTDKPIRITRIARGIPVGADITYADAASMAVAINSRRSI